MSILRPNRRLASIPAVSEDLANHTQVLMALKQAVEVGKRDTSDVANSFVRVQDLVDIGLIDLKGGVNASIGADFSQIAGIGDLSGAAAGDFLRFDGSEWNNQQLGLGDITQGMVTQHQAALSIDWGQLTNTPDFSGFLSAGDNVSELVNDADYQTGADLASAISALSSVYQPLSPVLTAYAGGDTPSAFTLGIVDSADAAAWRAAIGAGTSNFDGAFSSLSGVPTTLAGYGITDAYTDSEVDGLLAGYTPTSGLSAVALSNDYNDLTNLPTLFDGDYSSLSGIPPILGEFTGLTDAAGVLTNDGSGNLSWEPAFDGDWSSLSGVPAVLTALGGLTDAAGVLTNDGSGNLSWAPGGGGGTVTSVGLSVPSELSVSGSPITTSGTLALSWATGQTANRFLATPDGSTGAVSLRAIASGDLPAINLASSGAGGVTGTLPDANLSSNVALKNAANTWSGSNTFRGSLSVGGTVASDGYLVFTGGDASHTGYVSFYAPSGVRQGYIGYAAASGAPDAGTIPYVAGAHAFTGDVTVSGSITGSGTGLTNIPDGALSSNVPLKNANNMFTGAVQTISGTLAEWKSLDGTVAASMRAWSGGALGLFGTTSNHGLQIRTNDAARIAITDVGNVSINAPSSGSALSITGITGQWTQEVAGHSTGHGLYIAAGSTGTHAPLYVRNAAGSLDIIRAQGDGSVLFGEPTGGGKGAGTLNTAGNIFLNNNPVPCIVSGGAAGGGRITISTSAPSGTPADGDIWIQHAP